MAAPSYLIVGLGNPGEDYARTRHNIGFMAVDAIAAHYRCPAWKKKCHGLLTSSERFYLFKPQTFMNLSGEAVVAAAGFFKLEPEHIFVFHDDLDLLPGQVKIKRGGGSGGHNGLKSLDAHVGTDYWRVRLGIGRPTTEQGVPVKGDAVTNYVLNPFAKADKVWLEPLLAALASELDLLLDGEKGDYMDRLPKSER